MRRGTRPSRGGRPDSPQASWTWNRGVVGSSSVDPSVCPPTQSRTPAGVTGAHVELNGRDEEIAAEARGRGSRRTGATGHAVSNPFR